MPPTFNTVLEANLHQLNEEKALHFYAKGENIPILAQGIWQVAQGLVQLSTLYPSGEEGLLGWVGPSMCFSLSFSCMQTYQAKALSDVHLMWFSVREVETTPHLARDMFPQLMRRLRQVEAMLAIAGQRRVEDRLVQLLMLLKQEIGESIHEGTRLMVRLTHQEIASAIGTSRVTVTRMLGKLRKEGAIAVDAKRHIIIKDCQFQSMMECSVLREF
ncbi:Crp/Fnr family transcriptional regulator [Phormidium sp. CCY1219]|uniref:Crp/Fnr family transcriptional regulator n=1 Tax=Phormidium sp. CCY1219 TaxID=2886104 RepID=UPI002D1EBC98|nr:Crp/Fnr family transcriptional regulator [Phormidium sp. CCY1219]MEB3829126.1 Crp/Fnr family transcriptional regulator [Phormidium sp. CCY1219]